AVSARALAQWRHHFGTDYWSIVMQGWQIIGLNALLFESGDSEDAAQWRWLEGELAASDAKMGVVVHKPLFREHPAEQVAHQGYLPSGARLRLWETLRARDLRFVVSGHVHQHRHAVLDGVDLVWAPSCAYLIHDKLQETVGRKVVGVLTLELAADSHCFS